MNGDKRILAAVLWVILGVLWVLSMISHGGI